MQVGPIAQRWVRGYLSKKFPSCEFASFLGAVCCCLHTEAGTDLAWPGRSTVLSSSFVCECHLLFDRSFSRLAWPGQPTVGVAKGGHARHFAVLLPTDIPHSLRLLFIVFRVRTRMCIYRTVPP